MASSSKRYRGSEQEEEKPDTILVRLGPTASTLLRAQHLTTNASLSALVDQAVVSYYGTTPPATVAATFDSYPQRLAEVQRSDVYQDAVARLSGAPDPEET